MQDWKCSRLVKRWNGNSLVYQFWCKVMLVLQIFFIFTSLVFVCVLGLRLKAVSLVAI